MIPALSASHAFSLSTRVLLTLVTLSVVASEGFSQQVQIGPRTYSVAEIKQDDFTGHNQQYPASVQLANDDIAVGWESWYQVSSNGDCVGKPLASDGSQIIGERLLNAFNTSGWEYCPAIAPQPDGGFIVTWGDTSADVHAQRFEARQLSERKYQQLPLVVDWAHELDRFAFDLAVDRWLVGCT